MAQLAEEGGTTTQSCMANNTLATFCYYVGDVPTTRVQSVSDVGLFQECCALWFGRTCSSSISAVAMNSHL